MATNSEIKPTFFPTPLKFHQWLEKNQDKKDELWVGFHKKASGKKSITYPEALDEALCFGWIDGVRKSIDDTSYMIRFGPRRARSIWSLVNMKRVNELIEAGRMRPRGLTVFAARDPKLTGVYSFENRAAKLAEPLEKRFRKNKKAWEFFQRQPPGYQKLMIFRIMSAKQDETRSRRLEQLIDSSEKNLRIGLLTGKPES